MELNSYFLPVFLSIVKIPFGYKDIINTTDNSDCSDSSGWRDCSNRSRHGICHGRTDVIRVK